MGHAVGFWHHRLMARDLNADQEMLRAVLTLAQNRDIPRAAAIAEGALAEGFEHPLLLNVLAARLEAEGRLEEAVRLLERAVALAPGDVPARNALALCLQRLDRPAEALQHVKEILSKHPGLGFAHANEGNALIALGSLAAARTSHLKALELDPGNLAALASLGSIATHRGEHAEARRWAEQLLARVPGFPDGVLSLTAAELADGAIDRADRRAVRAREPRTRHAPTDCSAMFSIPQAATARRLQPTPRATKGCGSFTGALPPRRAFSPTPARSPRRSPQSPRRGPRTGRRCRQNPAAPWAMYC